MVGYNHKPKFSKRKWQLITRLRDHCHRMHLKSPVLTFHPLFSGRIVVNPLKSYSGIVNALKSQCNGTNIECRCQTLNARGSHNHSL